MRTDGLVAAHATERADEVDEVADSRPGPRRAVLHDVVDVSSQQIDRWRDHPLEVGIKQE